jgi:hypothetical protein
MLHGVTQRRDRNQCEKEGANGLSIHCVQNIVVYERLAQTPEWYLSLTPLRYQQMLKVYLFVSHPNH